MKKILLTLGTVATAMTPIITATACTSQYDSETASIVEDTVTSINTYQDYRLNVLLKDGAFTYFIPSDDDSNTMDIWNGPNKISYDDWEEVSHTEFIEAAKNDDGNIVIDEFDEQFVLLKGIMDDATEYFGKAENEKLDEISSLLSTFYSDLETVTDLETLIPVKETFEAAVSPYIDSTVSVGNDNYYSLDWQIPLQVGIFIPNSEVKANDNQQVALMMILNQYLQIVYEAKKVSMVLNEFVQGENV